MRSISDHIENIKGKPHHVKKRVAFGTAGALTAVIALVWLAGSVSSGVFALKDTSFADAAGATPVIVTTDAVPTGVAAAAAAVAKKDEPAHIEIVDVSASVKSVKKAEATTIPF